MHFTCAFLIMPAIEQKCMQQDRLCKPYIYLIVKKFNSQINSNYCAVDYLFHRCQLIVAIFSQAFLQDCNYVNMITKAYRYQCRATVTMSSTAIPGTPYLLKTCISLLDSKYNSTMCTEAVDLRLTRTSALIMKLYINKYPLDGLLQSRQLMCYNC